MLKPSENYDLSTLTCPGKDKFVQCDSDYGYGRMIACVGFGAFFRWFFGWIRCFLGLAHLFITNEHKNEFIVV